MLCRPRFARRCNEPTPDGSFFLEHRKGTALRKAPRCVYIDCCGASRSRDDPPVLEGQINEPNAATAYLTTGETGAAFLTSRARRKPSKRSNTQTKDRDRRSVPHRSTSTQDVKTQPPLNTNF